MSSIPLNYFLLKFIDMPSLKSDTKFNIEIFDPEESNHVNVIKICNLNYERIKLH